MKAAADQRDVLAPGVHDDLDRRVGEHRRECGPVELLRQRVEDQDALARVLAFGDRELHQAQQRAVAALAHELGVEASRPAARAPSASACSRSRSEAALTAWLPAAGTATRPVAGPPRRRRRLPCARTHWAGAEQAGFTAGLAPAQKVFRKA